MDKTEENEQYDFLESERQWRDAYKPDAILGALLHCFIASHTLAALHSYIKDNRTTLDRAVNKLLADHLYSDGY